MEGRDLKGHQKISVAHMICLERLRIKGSINADARGLGKTPIMLVGIMAAIRHWEIAAQEAAILS